ncbi:MAG: ABC transporter ATP-binding protein [Acidobacteriia bacterium]|nr:ABC transporter ATP-binding protein [Terriglobia bacterium]
MNSPLWSENLTRRFGRLEAVCDLNLMVPEGSLFALLGPNGAGKTTTIHVLMNLLRPSSGRVMVMGKDSTRLGSSELAQIGYVSENQKLPGWMTLEQLLQFCKPLYPTWDGLLGEKLVRQFDLPPGRKIRTLSRGQRIKAAMVTALAYRPRLLVLDEPFSGLDVAVREELVQGMLELAGQGDWTLFISSHDLEDIENLVDWVGFINEGRLLFSEELERLQARFREVEVTLPEAAAAATNLPRSWGPLQVAGKVLRFIETQYQEGESEAHIRRIFPTAENLFISPLSLRSIFVTLARQSKGSSREEKTL